MIRLICLFYISIGITQQAFKVHTIQINPGPELTTSSEWGLIYRYIIPSESNNVSSEYRSNNVEVQNLYYNLSVM